jgi:hypothetical protein
MLTPEKTGADLLVSNFTKSNFNAVITDYKVFNFQESHSDAACVSRIIEIFTLNKLRSEGEKLASVTGLSIPDTAATAEEINLLLSRCSKLCNIEKKELGVRQGAVYEAKLDIQQATGESRSISEVKTRRAGRTERADADHKYQMAQSRFAEQSERVTHFESIAGLLLDEAAYIGKGINLPLLHSFHKTTRVSTELIRALQKSDAANAVSFTCEALDELTEAIREITKKCTPPTDRYELANSGVLKSQAYQYYYHIDSYFLRSLVSADEYVLSVIKRNKRTEQKKRIFSN